MEVSVTIMKDFRDIFAEFRVLELYNYLSANAFDLLMTAVVPSPLLGYRFECMSYRTPSLFARLQSVPLLQVLTSLRDEPAGYGPPVFGALKPPLRKRW